MTQNRLGNALAMLGMRENGPLEEAVAAYRAALKEWTRDGVPLRWAATQNNLGVVLETLGERESGLARLEEAVAAYEPLSPSMERPLQITTPTEVEPIEKGRSLHLLKGRGKPHHRRPCFTREMVQER
jgi:Tetratricopeptide repeat